MHRLPLVNEASAPRAMPDASAATPSVATPSAPPAPSRFGRGDYVRYGFKLATGMLGSRLFGVHRPLMVNIEPTHRCNLDCTYCDKVDPHSPQMQTEKALRMLDELAEIGTLSVCFDGGEPLVHPGIEHFVRRAKSHGMRVSMSTNGHLFQRKRNVLSFVDKVKI